MKCPMNVCIYILQMSLIKKTSLLNLSDSHDTSGIYSPHPILQSLAHICFRWALGGLRQFIFWSVFSYAPSSYAI